MTFQPTYRVHNSDDIVLETKSLEEAKEFYSKLVAEHKMLTRDNPPITKLI